MLIGDKTGPAIIAHTYGDVRPDHLFKQAQRIRLTVQANQRDEGQGSILNGIHMSPDVAQGSSVVLDDESALEDRLPQRFGCDNLHC